MANIGVVLMNKFLLSFYGFKFPVLLTLLHMAACSLLAFATVAAGMIHLQRISGRAQLLKVVLLSTVFTVTIILGNVSLRYIPVSFNQAIGACTPFFTAILSLVIQGKRESARTYAALVPVVVGIVVATGFEPSFHMLGFCVCMLATGLRALKSVLQVCSLSILG
jgi:drug/metabolite transporter (DMT)-like permease